MRLKFGIIENGELRDGADYVSRETQVSNTNPSFCLFLREPGKRMASGSIFVFTIPPQSLEWKRGINTASTPTRHGYVITQGASQEPHITLRGHFGWQLRKVEIARGIFPIGLRTTRRYDQQLNDTWIPLPYLDGRNTQPFIEQLIKGTLTLRGDAQYLDGTQSWRALRDFFVYYQEENQKRISIGQNPLEMVYLDTLHNFRWVVVPKEHPSLTRTYQTQGLHPYDLTLMGVYDDSRARVRQGDALWS